MSSSKGDSAKRPRAVGGVTVRVTAVLERTCVYEGSAGDRLLARKEDIWVEADRLAIRRRGPA